MKLIFHLNILLLTFFSSTSWVQKAVSNKIEHFSTAIDLKLAEAFAQDQMQQTNFSENKGQIKQLSGADAPNVAYILPRSTTNIDLLRTGGIAWQFNKLHYPEGYLALQDNPTDESSKKREAMEKEIRLEIYRMDVRLVRAYTNARILAEGKSSDFVQYYNHNALAVHHYKKITYQDVYPGIDWVIHVSEDNMKLFYIKGRKVIQDNQ